MCPYVNSPLNPTILRVMLHRLRICEITDIVLLFGFFFNVYRMLKISYETFWDVNQTMKRF